MERFSATSRSYGVEVTAAKNSNANGNHMFVGKSQPRPLDLPRTPVKDAITVAAGTNKKKKKATTTSLFLSAKLWTDPEMKRKRRVAKYKMYSAEGKIKESLKKGIRWIKRKCSRIVHGF
ncbi:hypothetical protein MLD38_015606 [Melastoma candidum]|uniref:Uncharacterized protein n=1 Tax=Melastoma candidum TaxID=119954 RepID=A0ACB9RGU1_9MYRT|nr:hypothetical protein MLD38_015606 [Melastoma candidum]